MATLTGKQLKDSYQGLLTIKTADDANPLSGRLENGLGNAITNLGIGTDSPSKLLTLASDFPEVQIEDTGVSFTANQLTAFGITDNTVALMKPFSTTNGGIWINGFQKGTAGNSTGVLLRGYVENDPSGVAGNIRLDAFKHDGAGAVTSVGNDGNILTVNNNNATKFVIKGSGNVGIGTDSPEKKLHIYDSTIANQAIRLGNPSAVPYGEIHYDPSGSEFLNITSKGTLAGYGNIRFYTGGTPTERMKIHSTGDISFRDTSTNEAFYWDASTARLGLGTTSPSKGLHLTFSNDNASIRFENTASAKVWDLTPANPNVSNSGFSLHNVTDNTVPFHVTNGGNVGIGTTEPDYKLQINGSGTVARFTDGTSHMDFYSGSGLNEIATASPLLLSVGGTERMRIDSSGNVGIGTAPDSILHAKGASATLTIENTTAGSSGSPNYSGIFFIQSNGTSTGASIQSGDQLNSNSNNDLIFTTRASGGGGHTEKLRILGGGGITFNGDTASANALDDYEEGTFDLTLGGSTTAPTTPVIITANYTKIGDVVHYNFTFNNVNTTGASGDIILTGFPFTTTSTNRSIGSVMIHTMADFNGGEYLNLYLGGTSTQAEILGSRTNNSWINAQHNAGTGRYLNASITVHVV